MHVLHRTTRNERTLGSYEYVPCMHRLGDKWLVSATAADRHTLLQLMIQYMYYQTPFTIYKLLFNSLTELLKDMNVMKGVLTRIQ